MMLVIEMIPHLKGTEHSKIEIDIFHFVRLFI